jgi:hypothetical protein
VQVRRAEPGPGRESPEGESILLLLPPSDKGRTAISLTGRPVVWPSQRGLARGWEV